VNLKTPHFQKARVSIGTRLLSHCACKTATCKLAEETGKKVEESHVEVPCSKPICKRFCEFVDLTNVITPAKFACKMCMAFPSREGVKRCVNLWRSSMSNYFFALCLKVL